MDGRHTVAVETSRKKEKQKEEKRCIIVSSRFQFDSLEYISRIGNFWRKMEEEEKEERKKELRIRCTVSTPLKSRAIDQSTKNKRQYQVLYLCMALEALYCSLSECLSLNYD